MDYRSINSLLLLGLHLIIGYVFQEIAWNLKGEVTKHTHREYGFAQVQINRTGDGKSSVDALFDGLGDELQVSLHPLNS